MNKDFVIPSALQICMDDIGWFRGHDMRHIGQPSSTGMPRKHHPLDYKIVNEVGKAIGMKVMCPLVVGEWDKDNLLRDEIGTTYEPHTWDRASKIDMTTAQKCFEEIENSDYIEFALHGVMHGNYDANGGQITEMEYFGYTSENDKTLKTLSEEEILRRIDIFERVYNSWGFTKKIHSYAAPNGIPSGIDWDDLEPMVKAFNKKGIKYWTNYWKGKELSVKYLDNILYVIKNNNVMIPWNAYDIDPAYVRDFLKDEDTHFGTVLGMHWPNFLKFNPENNMQTLPLWVDYFKRQSEIFGLMISKDIAFSCNQYIYKDLAKTDFVDNKIKIDVAPVYEQPSLVPNGEFYISIKNNKTPVKSNGCTFELYEKHADFSTYKIKHTDKQMEITVK